MTSVMPNRCGICASAAEGDVTKSTSCP